MEVSGALLHVTIGVADAACALDRGSNGGYRAKGAAEGGRSHRSIVWAAGEVDSEGAIEPVGLAVVSMVFHKPPLVAVGMDSKALVGFSVDGRGDTIVAVGVVHLVM